LSKARLPLVLLIAFTIVGCGVSKGAHQQIRPQKNAHSTTESQTHQHSALPTATPQVIHPSHYVGPRKIPAPPPSTARKLPSSNTSPLSVEPQKGNRSKHGPTPITVNPTTSIIWIVPSSPAPGDVLSVYGKLMSGDRWQAGVVMRAHVKIGKTVLYSRRVVTQKPDFVAIASVRLPMTIKMGTTGVAHGIFLYHGHTYRSLPWRFTIGG
jgi:hypothetical protein